MLAESQSSDGIWLEHLGEGPIMATAVHAGHEMRHELAPLIAIDVATRAREEDPYTDYWAHAVPTWLVPTRSRFEVDLNRSRDEAVYVAPEMAFGLHLWRKPLPCHEIACSLAEYDAFYAELGKVLDTMLERHRRLVVLDLHAYNHRRDGPDALQSTLPGLLESLERVPLTGQAHHGAAR